MSQPCRGGKGPVLLELLTYRRTGHSRRDTCQYQPPEEREDWSRRDPIERFTQVLIEEGIIDEGWPGQVRARIQGEFQAAVELAG